MYRKKRQQNPNDNVKYTLANVNLRDAKSTSANVIEVIPEGSPVQVVDRCSRRLV